MPESAVRVEKVEHGIRVSSDNWALLHGAESGGAWTSIRDSAGREFLRAPAASTLRLSTGSKFDSYSETYDAAARLRVETNSTGIPTVIAEGIYRNPSGSAIPVGYRRKTEYHPHGLIWTTLEVMSDSGCDDVVEIRAFELPLKGAWTDAFVRFHPTQAGGPDLLGGQAHFHLNGSGNAIPFISRFTPLQFQVCNSNGEHIDLFPNSDLSQWDTSFKPDPGLGCYRIQQGENSAAVELSPYCMALRRVKLKVQGSPILRLGISFPSSERKKSARFAPVSISAVESDLRALAKSGVQFLRVNPPIASNQEIAKFIETGHRHKLKALPAICLKELSSGDPAFVNARAWMHQAAPSLDMIYNVNGSGPSGAWMCLKSGWFDHVKSRIESLLSSAPWDGLYLEGAAPHPCCHIQHARGPFHSDTEQLIEILKFARDRVGDQRILALNTGGTPMVFAENIADLVDEAVTSHASF